MKLVYRLNKDNVQKEEQRVNPNKLGNNLFEYRILNYGPEDP